MPIAHDRHLAYHPAMTGRATAARRESTGRIRPRPGPAARLPRIVVTVADPRRSASPDLADRKNARYMEAVERAGGRPVPLDETSTADERAAALAAMQGLLLSGGADLDPALYGEAASGASDVQPGRDELENAAWQAAHAGGIPVLGICRGFQAINVFLGGRLVQHVDGHRGPGYLEGPAATHQLKLVRGTRLASILGAADATLDVNTYHHQGVRPADLAPGLRVAGTSAHAGGDLVEAFEATPPGLPEAAPPGAFVIGVQCHPERTESTPPEFDRLFAAFVEAARRHATV